MSALVSRPPRGKFIVPKKREKRPREARSVFEHGATNRSSSRRWRFNPVAPEICPVIRSNAIFCSAVFVGCIALFMESKFTTISRNWSSPWMWGSFVFLWLFFARAFFNGFLKNAAARYLEREARKSRKAAR